MFLKRNWKLLSHILVWAILFFLPYILAFQAEGGGPRSSVISQILLINALMTICWAVVFYLNTSILIPRFLFHKKWGVYSLINLLLLVGTLIFNRWLYDLLGYEHPYSLTKALIFNGTPFLVFLLSGITYKTVTDRMEMQRFAKEKEQENLKTELAFLRSQISPHFLFNVLNSLVALVRLKSDKIEPTILKLSSILQYILYETNGDKVLLKSEVDYLQSYIDLQQLRFGDRLQLNLNIDLREDWHMIEPMLLIPFVENAFKHGTGIMEDPVINIFLQAYDNQLVFQVENKFDPDDRSKDHVSGIGLANVERRLDLLYGKQKNLSVDQRDGWYLVTLNLRLDS